MFRIAVVGDLSLQDPARLEKVMAAAWAANPDLIVHVGDIHPGYDVVRAYAIRVPKKVLAIPGNHDTEWDTRLGWPRQWRKETDSAVLVGLDNSQDKFGPADWAAMTYDPASSKPLFVFCHKPLSSIVLSDGSESGHIMNEGGAGSVEDRERLKGLVKALPDVLLIHGHYHGLSIVHTDYAECLIEGRGGAGPQLGYSIITVQPEGWVIHSVTLDG